MKYKILLILLVGFLSLQSQRNFTKRFELERDQLSESLKKIPLYTFTFREFDDSVKYKAARSKIFTYAKFKSAPLKLEDFTFFNPSLKFEPIDHSLSKADYNFHSLRYYLDTGSVTFLKDSFPRGDKWPANKFPLVYTKIPYEQIYHPFYILNHEVTNAEYREFVYYVRDSIARQLLAESMEYGEKYGVKNEKTGKIVLKWDKKVEYGSADDRYREIIEPLNRGEGARFFNRREPDVRKLNYSFYAGDELITINVYPDTLVWVHNVFIYASEPYANMYNWHYVYDNYPAVGLSYNQVKAFLNWKTRELQKAFNKKKLNLEIECALPSEVEIEMTQVMLQLEKDRLFFLERYNNENRSRLFDLSLFLNEFSGTYHHFSNNGIFAQLLMENALIRDSYHAYGFYFPVMSAKSEDIKQAPESMKASYIFYSGPGSVHFLNSNVSEWMNESFSGNDPGPAPALFPYKGNFTDLIRVEAKVNPGKIDLAKVSESIKITGDVAKQEWRLVRGANWFDQGFPNANLHKSTFSHPDSTYSTVGFRYVVRFREK
jgi:formylglycine-generating enzyme required for sulfatase activity